MCTSFIHRGEDTIIAMNFDNNGMRYKLTDKYPGWFVVLVDSGYGFLPSFGVSVKGEFFNNLMVPSNGRGDYKRPSSKVTHTSKLIDDLLSKKLSFSELENYLSTIEVVNTPNASSHNFLCDEMANTWIVEPGRENIYFESKAHSYNVLTNISLSDVKNGKAALNCSRFIKVSEALTPLDELAVPDAFEILKSVAQSTEGWHTAMSMVYSKKEAAVFYCYDQNYQDLLKSKF